MDFETNEPKKNVLEANVLAGGDVKMGTESHSPVKLVDFTDNTEKFAKKASESTEDFEHVDHDPLLKFTQPEQGQDKKIDSAKLMDDFVGSVKTQYGNVKADIGNEFAQFASNVKDTGSNILSAFDSKIDEKINQTKDFMAAERGRVEPQKSKEQQPKVDPKPVAPELFEDFDNEPFSSSPVNKLIKEDSEKFISSEDLLGDFKDERTKTPEPALQPQQKPDSVVKDYLPQPVKETRVEEKAKEGKELKEPQKTEVPIVSPPPTKEKESTITAPTLPKPMISAEEMFCRYGLVESLIYWRDVKKSGIVFGVGLIVLLAISCFSVISVFAYLSLLALAGTIAFRIYKTVLGAIQKTSEGHPFKEYLELDLTISQDKAQQIVNLAVAHINGFVSELRRLFLVEDLVDSLKFGVILWILTYIGAWFNGMTLVILAFVALFTLPKVYENNKQSIDTYLDLVRSKFLEITDKVKAAVPIGKKPETDKDK